MSFEKPPQNPYEGKFSTLPSEKEESDVEKIKRKKQGKPTKEEEMDQKMEQANARKKMAEQEKRDQEQESNNELLSKFDKLAEAVEEYEEKLGNAFTEQKDGILSNLKESADKKTGVDMDNPQEKQALEDTLLNKFQEEIRNRFNS